MALWTRRKTQRQSASNQQTAFAVLNPPPEMTEGGLGALYTPRVTRKEAISVPAVKRGRDLICPTIGGLPVRLHGPDRVVRDSPLLEQPERAYTRVNSFTRLAEDMVFDGVAWWFVEQFGWNDRPVEVSRISPNLVQERPDGTIYVNGGEVPSKRMIRFDSPNDPLLIAGARAIKTCLKLDTAAARHADEPIPLMFFTRGDGAMSDPDTDTVKDFLNQWRTARNTNSTGFVPDGLKLNQPNAMTPEQLQFAESRQHAVLEIARLMGIDAEELGVSTTSRTYFNAEDRRQSFIDFTLGPYISEIEQRLSRNDVTLRGEYVKVAIEGLLRGDTITRYQSYELGQKVGAVLPEEVRALEDKPELTPAQRQALAPTPVPVQNQGVPNA